MTWSKENAQNDESSKIRWSVVPYFHGDLCLDIGAGPYKVFPHFVCVDNGHHWQNLGIDVPCKTAERLPMFSSQSADCVYSSHLLEHIQDYRGALREWSRIVKPGGHIVLYLPHKLFYPNIGVYGANIDHKHDFMPQDIIDAMREIGGFDLLENEDRNEADEYSFFQVYRRLPNKRDFIESWKNPKPDKTCAVIRYGAIGDQIMTSSLFPSLKEQGYETTLYCQAGDGYEAVKHDPHIDHFIIQGKNEIPPQFLNEFWDYTRKKYTKFVNLCESIESTLLAAPGRAQWEWPNELRQKYLDRNYLEWTHELAQCPPPYRPKFYSTLEERAWARKKAGQFGKRNILWSLAGSSGHKVWPHLDTVIAGVMVEYPDTHIVLVGDEYCQILEVGWDNEPRVHCMSGKWTIRESMAFAEVADLIIGTETGLLNAAGSMDAWKIVTLSHSSENQLTKHWRNVIALNQPEGVGCPKHPCLQLHGAEGHSPWEDCPKEETTGTAMCQFHIGPKQMFSAIQRVLGESAVIPIRKVA